MLLIRPFVVLSVWLWSVAMAAEPVPESVLLKQQALPSSHSVPIVTSAKT
ncbi:MAG: hypothetical protein H0W78_16210 [Planctomycetes bacterium]|nr:hypothetical protein [Planctomycetota bacterium]